MLQRHARRPGDLRARGADPEVAAPGRDLQAASRDRRRAGEDGARGALQGQHAGAVPELGGVDPRRQPRTPTPLTQRHINFCCDVPVPLFELDLPPRLALKQKLESVPGA